MSVPEIYKRFLLASETEKSEKSLKDFLELWFSSTFLFTPLFVLASTKIALQITLSFIIWLFGGYYLNKFLYPLNLFYS